MTSMTRENWQRVSRRRPCPVCQKPDWCLYAGPADAPTAAICARTESAKRCGEGGWLHELRDDGPTWAPWRRTITRAVRMMAQPENGKPDFARLAAEYQAATKPQALGCLAESLGLSPESLRRLSVGWSRRHSAWTFPMQNAGGKVVGVRLRRPDGGKRSVCGGHEGLFVSDGLGGDRLLLITEGPTDTAALLDLGFQAVGRPSCTGGVRLLVEWVRQWRPSELVIVADADGPGQKGADSLAAVLVAYAPSVRVITPSTPCKDARQWKQSGATAADVLGIIEAAEPRRLGVSVKRKAGRRCSTKTV